MCPLYVFPSKQTCPLWPGIISHKSRVKPSLRKQPAFAVVSMDRGGRRFSCWTRLVFVFPDSHESVDDPHMARDWCAPKLLIGNTSSRGPFSRPAMLVYSGVRLAWSFLGRCNGDGFREKLKTECGGDLTKHRRVWPKQPLKFCPSFGRETRIVLVWLNWKTSPIFCWVKTPLSHVIMVQQCNKDVSNNGICNEMSPH